MDLDGSFQTAIESIEPTEALAKQWQAFVDASAALNGTEAEALKAAKSGDVDEANAILADTSTYEAYSDAGEDLGACGTDFDVSEYGVTLATEAAGDAPQPENTAEDAANRYLDALMDGDCKAIADANHSQNYAEVAEDCSETAKSFKGSEMLASADYGPVGGAMIGPADNPFYSSYILDPETGDLEYTSTVYVSPNGLAPANEGIDADESVTAALDALRADDVEAFNETLPLDTVEGGGSFLQTGKSITSLGSDPVYQKKFVADVKSDAEAEPVRLGANQTLAYYLLDTEARDYVLTALHDAGSVTHYSFNSYWAIEE